MKPVPLGGAFIHDPVEKLTDLAVKELPKVAVTIAKFQQHFETKNIHCQWCGNVCITARTEITFKPSSEPFALTQNSRSC